jgi:hypothetical protein
MKHFQPVIIHSRLQQARGAPQPCNDPALNFRIQPQSDRSDIPPKYASTPLVAQYRDNDQIFIAKPPLNRLSVESTAWREDTVD